MASNNGFDSESNEINSYAFILGDVNIDIITPPFNPDLLKEGESSIVLDEFKISLGGNAINVAGTLAALNAPHLFLGGLGDCGNSIWIKNKCKNLGINAEFGILEGKSAGITFALTYNDGRRQFVATLGTNAQITMDKLNIDAIYSILSEKKPRYFHLHRAGFWYTPKLKGKPTIELFKKIIEMGGETSLDVGWDPEGFTDENRKILYDTLKYTNYFFANEKELKAITRKDSVEDACHEILELSNVIKDPVIVIHRGEKGCAIARRNGDNIKIHEIAPIVVKKVINPTGSGDVFNGAFIYGLLHGWNLIQCAEFAGKVAVVHLTDINKIYPTLNDLRENVFCK